MTRRERQSVLNRIQEPQKYILFLIVVGVLWVLLAGQTKTLLLSTAATHLGMIIIFVSETWILGWLMHLPKRVALPTMLVAAWICSALASRGFPTVLLIHSGEIGFATVLTPLAAITIVLMMRQFALFNQLSDQLFGRNG